MRILLRNALIRSTLTYALHTQTNKQKTDIQKLETFMFKCIKQIHEPSWGKQNNTYQKNALPEIYKIPTINKWLQKLMVMHHLRQTCKTWHIHTEKQHTVTINEQMWQKNGNCVRKCIRTQKTAQKHKKAT